MSDCLFYCPTCWRTFTWATTCPEHGCFLLALPWDSPILGGGGDPLNLLRRPRAR